MNSISFQTFLCRHIKLSQTLENALCYTYYEMTDQVLWFQLQMNSYSRNWNIWIEYQFLSGIRDSRKAGSLWGMMRSVGGIRKSIYHSWLVKGLGLGLLCWVFKGVQEEIPSEEPSTLQIGSVAFPAGQYTSQQFHPCRRLFDQDGHQDSSSASL